MENNGDTPNEYKGISKVRSFISTSKSNHVNQPSKRKSFNVAGKSFDLAMNRLKKSKLVKGESRPSSTNTQGASEMFMDICSTSQPFGQGMDTGSLMSMNFSHYELLRNVSRSNCNSDSAFSGTTCSFTNTDVKDEQLERYFRSIEIWSRNYMENDPSTMPLNSSDKSTT